MESQKYNLTTSKEQKGENSANIKAKIIQTRNIQKERFQKMNKNILTNSQMQGEIFNSICLSNKKLDPIINTLTEKYHFSLRSISKILKVARTIADFENNSDIKEENLIEAISYKDVVRY
jgi:magnesium chelatase family protein